MYMIVLVICNTRKGGVFAQKQFLQPTMSTHKPRERCTDRKERCIPVPSVVLKLKESGWYYIGTDMHL